MSVHDFKVARLAAMAAAGLSFTDILTQGYTVVASSIFVQYRTPAAFSEELLELQSGIAHSRGARMTWQQERYRSGTGEWLALARPLAPLPPPTAGTSLASLIPRRFFGMRRHTAGCAVI